MEALSARRLDQIAAAGAALTVVVVAASALLRLGTSLDAGGNVAAELPARLQFAVRLAHRIAASGVAIAAFAALVVCVRGRSPARALALALGTVIALTVMLAVVGPLTPGYRSTSVTIANAAGGMALACAFVWLGARAQPRAEARATARSSGIAALALAAVLLHAAIGTAASFGAMHATRALDPVHVALGPVVVGLAVAAAARTSSASRPLRAAIAAAALAQMALGAAVAAVPPLAGIAWLHAVGACVLAVLLAALSSSR